MLSSDCQLFSQSRGPLFSEFLQLRLRKQIGRYGTKNLGCLRKRGFNLPWLENPAVKNWEQAGLAV